VVAEEPAEPGEEGPELVQAEEMVEAIPADQQPAEVDEAGNQVDLTPEPAGDVPEAQAAEADAEPQPEFEPDPSLEAGEPAPEPVQTPPIETGASDEEPLPEDDGMLGFWRDEDDPLVAARPGTLIADRYLLIEALDVQTDSVLFDAQDMVRCWQCGHEENARGDAFCAKCGAALDRKRRVRLVQVRHPDAAPPGGEEVAERLSHENRTFLRLVTPEAEPELADRGIRFLVGQASHAGRVRDLDEDSLLSLTFSPTYESRTGPALGLFVVADGMGGHESGEIASKMALQVFAGNFIRGLILPQLSGELALEEDIPAILRRAILAANDAVYLSSHKRGNDMGTTLSAAFVRDDRLFLAHVGDCRIYRWNADGLEQLTTDHSVVASMIAKGEAAPEEIYTHPHRSIVYRCVGDKPSVEVDTDVLPLAPGDRIVVCCDGLWEMIRSQGIEDVMLQESDPQVACDLLVKHANMAGGEDNISVIVVQVEAI
jgi:serine/threonine protein phosphatase PrpC